MSDTLVHLSGTRVSTSFDCLRAAVLEEQLGGSSSAKAVEGTLLHELFQVCLLKGLHVLFGGNMYCTCAFPPKSLRRHTSDCLSIPSDCLSIPSDCLSIPSDCLSRVTVCLSRVTVCLSRVTVYPE